MVETFKVTTQFDDLTGNCAFDGHEGPPLFELAKRTNMHPGYFPVGFELSRLNPNKKGKLPFTLLAARMIESGKNIEEFLKRIKLTNELRVYRFRGEIDQNDLPKLFKRISINAISEGLPPEKLRIYQDYH